MKVLEGALTREDKLLDGETVFQLYDTFGFPVDLTADIARERGVRIDYAGFEAAMERQRERARAASKFRMGAGVEYSGEPTEFHGYDTLTLEGTVLAIYVEGAPAQEIGGRRGGRRLDRTRSPESGGQVGDTGRARRRERHVRVEDTQKIQPAEVFGHTARSSGKLSVGDAVQAGRRRARARRAESLATHLMHCALRGVLGEHVQQSGSLVDAERTRFDFSHNDGDDPDQIRKVEDS